MKSLRRHINTRNASKKLRVRPLSPRAAATASHPRQAHPTNHNAAAMRSRFLATDYFSSRSSAETLTGFNVPSLAPPLLPPSDPLHLPNFSLFDPDPQIISYLDSFPIEDALSKFLSDVVPRHCRSREETSSDYAEIGSLEDVVNSVADVRDDSTSAICVGGSEVQQGFPFELVEILDLPLGKREFVSSSGAKEDRIHFDAADTTIARDTVDIELGVTFTRPYEVALQTCSVQDIQANYNEMQNRRLMKNPTSSPEGQLKHTTKLPQFEVSEVSPELSGEFPMEDVFSLLLPKMDLKHVLDDLVIVQKEFLGSTNTDVLEHLSGYTPAVDYLEHRPVCLDSMLEMDLLHLNNSMLIEKNSVFYQVTSDGHCSQLPCSIQLPELQIFDVPSPSFSEQLSIFQTVELETSKMFQEDMDTSLNFYESDVSFELVLVDDKFKSLPAPVICDESTMRNPSSIIEDILSSLNPHPLSACDGIYLDWHPLLEGTCNLEICSTYMCMLEEASDYRLNFELPSTNEEIEAIDFDFLDGSVTSSSMPEVSVKIDEVIPAVYGHSFQSSTGINKAEIVIADNKEHIPVKDREKVPFLFKSMSQDLSFFLDVRRGTARSCKDESRNKIDTQIKHPIVLSVEPVSTCCPKASSNMWDIEVHQVNQADHILCLINHIQDCYLTILKHDTDLRTTGLLQETSDIKLLSLPKEKLLELISDARHSANCDDKKVEALVALCAIKQLAYFLCFFGVHTAQLYLSNLMRSIDCMIVRLRSIEPLIESACWRAERQLIESHPSLHTVEEILRSNTSHDGRKILIVAEKVFWLPLNLKMSSLKIKIHEVKRTLAVADELDISKHECTNAVLEPLIHSECLLVSHEDVTASFPFNKFSVILEYGGPHASSRISSLSVNLHNLPRLHFLKVAMEDNGPAKAFCEDFDIFQNLKFSREWVSKSMSNTQGKFSNKRILGILNFLPVEEKNDCISSESANQTDDYRENMSAMSIPYPMITKNINSSTPSIPDLVVIVNTRSSEKHMLIYRRSSYQKILAMEKAGVQVVERDIDLPLDLMFTAAGCLVWYEAKNISDNTTETVEGSSIHALVENIATNILMSLSFAFSCCILIFEGQSSFLAAVMESSGALYATAASLGMKLQLFCLYAPESTDEIILSCIKNAIRLNAGIYQAMPESETLGECFLTRFPSMNPLSAHAILFSGGMLVEYLEWSPERRLQAIGRYQIPVESISLFNSLCRFGEMGESKSVMTECSSVESEANSRKLQSHRKRQGYAMDGAPSIDGAFDDSLYVEPLNMSNDSMEMPRVPQTYQSRNTKMTWSHKFSINDEDLNKDGRGNTSLTDCFDKNDMLGYNYFDEKFSDRVLRYNSNFIGEKFPPAPGATGFSWRAKSRSEPASESSLPRRGSLFGCHSHTFPTSSEINCDTDTWTTPKNQKQGLKDKMLGRMTLGSNKETPTEGHEYLTEKYVQEGTRNVYGNSSQEIPSPLRVQSLHSVKSSRKRGPELTIEFLQRMKENRMFQQTLPCNTCPSCPGSSKKNNIVKNKGPSTLDSCRYEEVAQVNGTIKQKQSKGSSVRLNSNVENLKKSSFLGPSLTPVDKRNLYLSFTRNGSEKQSKLVWRSRKSPGVESFSRIRNSPDVDSFVRIRQSPGTDSCTRKRFREEI